MNQTQQLIHARKGFPSNSVQENNDPIGGGEAGLNQENKKGLKCRAKQRGRNYTQQSHNWPPRAEHLTGHLPLVPPLPR